MDMCLEKSNLINLNQEGKDDLNFCMSQKLNKYLNILTKRKQTNKQAQIYSEASFNKSLIDNFHLYKFFFRE